MLIEFTCQNFRSFKEATTFSMVAESRLKLNRDQDRVFQMGESPRLLSSAGLFGLNAGGKTNLLKALRVAVHVIGNTDHDNLPNPKHPLLATFALDESSVDQPTMIELSLWDKENDNGYTYGFKISPEGIVAEWFYITSRGGINLTKKRIFERNGGNFKFGDSVGASIKRLQDRVRPEASAVSVFSQFNHSDSKRLVDLVRPPKLNILNIEGSQHALDYAVDKHGDVDLSRVVEVVKRADLGIEDIEIKEDVITYDKLSPGIRRALPFMPRRRDDVKFSIRKVATTHSKYSGGKEQADKARLSLKDDGSRGTMMFIGLITAALEALSAGGVLLVDELGSSMHPFLTKMVVDQFDRRRTNGNFSQLVYNSHEIYLLGQEINLRRDQIWLVDKDEFGASHLKRLSEYQTRPDYDIARNYIAGRFGAIPFVMEG